MFQQIHYCKLSAPLWCSEKFCDDVCLWTSAHMLKSLLLKMENC